MMLMQPVEKVFTVILFCTLLFSLSACTFFNKNPVADVDSPKAEADNVPDPEKASYKQTPTDQYIYPAGFNNLSGPAQKNEPEPLQELLEIKSVETGKNNSDLAFMRPKAIREGWKFGFFEAEEIYKTNIARRVRDYRGATLYHLLTAPDVVLISESRDPETFRGMIESAEIGVTAYSTVHTRSVPETISRIINVFPVKERNQVTATLLTSLRLVVSHACLHIRMAVGKRSGNIWPLIRVFGKNFWPVLRTPSFPRQKVFWPDPDKRSRPPPRKHLTKAELTITICWLYWRNVNTKKKLHNN